MTHPVNRSQGPQRDAGAQVAVQDPDVRVPTEPTEEELHEAQIRKSSKPLEEPDTDGNDIRRRA